MTIRRIGLDTVNKRQLMSNLYAHNRRIDTAEKLRRGKCFDCEMVVTIDNSVGFDWDHIDRKTKHKEVSKLRNGSTSAMLVEIAKCDLRCAICHRIKTLNENENQPIITPDDTQMRLF